MQRREVNYRNISWTNLSRLDVEGRLISATDALIRYGDSLISSNMGDRSFLHERNAMTGPRANDGPDGLWVSQAVLRILYPRSTVIIHSRKELLTGEKYKKQAALAKSEDSIRPIGGMAVGFSVADSDGVKRLFKAKRIHNVRFSKKGPLDEFQLRVFQGVQVDCVGIVDEANADGVYEQLSARLDELF